jgi:hypothetical protein
MSDLRKTQINQDIETTSPIPVYSFTPVERQKSSSLAQKSSNFLSYDLSDVRQSLIVSSALILTNTVIYILVENGTIPLQFIGL